MTRQGRLLRLLLRIIGTGGLLAVPCIFLPYSWMDAAYRWSGLGPHLPGEPVVGYLARSTTAFYAGYGGLLWVLSFDLRRFRPALCYVAAATILFGLVLLGTDLVEAMPLWWRLSEGPPIVVFGAAILALSIRLGRDGEQNPREADSS